MKFVDYRLEKMLGWNVCDEMFVGTFERAFMTLVRLPRRGLSSSGRRRVAVRRLLEILFFGASLGTDEPPRIGDFADHISDAWLLFRPVPKAPYDSGIGAEYDSESYALCSARMSNNSFDSSLISKTLQTELYVNQPLRWKSVQVRSVSVSTLFLGKRSRRSRCLVEKHSQIRL